MRLVAYLRTSTANGGNGDRLDAQEDACRAWAASAGHEVVAVCTDEGVSGGLDASERPGLAEALRLLEAGDADGLVVHRLDRLARELHVQEAVLATAWAAGASVFESVEGEVPRDDPNDPMRRAMRQMAGVFAELERAMVRVRLREGRRRKRARGGYAGGPKRRGYVINEEGLYVPTEQTREVIRRVQETRKGRTLRETADELNRLAIPTISGEGRWHPTMIRRVLARAARETT